MQQAMATRDRMMEYVLHTGSALFACPGGVGHGDYWGRPLFEPTR